MPNKHRDSKLAKCPFFNAQENQKIYCEGVEDGVAMHLAFDSKEHKKAYCARYCNKNFPRCPYYRMLDALYDCCGNHS